MQVRRRNSAGEKKDTCRQREGFEREKSSLCASGICVCTIFAKNLRTNYRQFICFLKRENMKITTKSNVYLPCSCKTTVLPMQSEYPQNDLFGSFEYQRISL